MPDGSLHRLQRERLMDYSLLKVIHMSAAALSLTGFLARGIGMMAGAQWVRGRTARTVPHLVDTVLLVSAVALAFTLSISPLQAPWLATKIAALLVYIGLGMVALRPGRPLPVRIIAWVAAMGVFGFIVSVALTKSPRGLFG